MKNKELLHSVTIKDCKVEITKGSGKGGQNRNKRDTCVRITHLESGAVGFSCDERKQRRNKIMAFKRMCHSDKFKIWHKRKIAELMRDNQAFERKIEEKTNEMMQDKYLKIEYYDLNKKDDY